MKVFIALFLVLGLYTNSSWACPFHDPESPKWNPLGREAYITSSFAENRGTRYHAGIDWSTEMEEGWPVQTPEDGIVLELRESPFGYGKAVLFQGVTGHQWLFAHLSGFHPKLDSAFTAEKIKRKVNQLTWSPPKDISWNQFKEYELLAYSGSTGIGNPHLHMELRDKTGKTVLNPCFYGIACHDTVPTFLMGAAVWDAAKPSAKISLTSAEALSRGCLEVDPSYQEPRMALKLVDYSRVPFENPMSIYEMTVRVGDKLLFNKEYQQLTYGQMSKIQEELIWTEEVDTAGDWHSIAPGTQPNSNVQGSGRELSQALRNLVRLSDKKAAASPLKVEVLDFRYNTATFVFAPRPQCQPSYSAPLVKYQDSVLFTFLARPWIHLGICATGEAKVSVLDSMKQILDNQICAAFPHEPVQIAALLEKWPRARTITMSLPKQQSKAIAIHPVQLRPDQTIQWNQDGVHLILKHHRPLFPTALAWQIQDSSAGLPNVLALHPKGFFLKENAKLCVQKPEHPKAQLYWLGESTQKWFIFSKQDSLHFNGITYQCASPDELRDLAFHVDSIAPQLGKARDTLAMIVGKAQKVWRIPLIETGSGIPHGNAIQAEQNGRWIPVEYDSEPSEIVIQKSHIKTGVPVNLLLKDEAGNSARLNLKFTE